MPFLGVSEVMIHEEALYQVYVGLPLPYLYELLESSDSTLFYCIKGQEALGERKPPPRQAI